MLFNKDPVPIFVQADKTNRNIDESGIYDDTDEILICLDQIETNRCKIFDLADTNIKKIPS